MADADFLARVNVIDYSLLVGEVISDCEPGNGIVKDD
jgi:hypothetical protein